MTSKCKNRNSIKNILALQENEISEVKKGKSFRNLNLIRKSETAYEKKD
jgi:hypothetical protein